jgi:hypothetical protein
MVGHMVTITVKRSTRLVILISLLLTLSVFLISNTYSSASAARVPIVGGGNSISKFILKIDGIDYSTLSAQVWVTTGSITISKIINPVSLLDPTDDGDGVILVPLAFKKGLIKTGEKFTACIKVLHDNDKFGDHLACQQGIMSNTHLFQPQQLAGTEGSGNNNSIVVRLSL